MIHMTPDQTDHPVVGVDFDGTLAEVPDYARGEKIGAPITSGFAKLAKVVEAGWIPVIHTSRGWWDYYPIKNWMSIMGYPDIPIVCGKLLAMAYIDDRSINATEDSWLP